MFNNFRGILSSFCLLIFSFSLFAQNNFSTNSKNSTENQSLKISQETSSEDSKSFTNLKLAFPNPILMNSENGCHFGNLNIDRFDSRINNDQRLQFCEALQSVSNKLNGNWSPELRNEINQLWQVLMNQDVKIRPMKQGVSAKIIAAAEAFTEKGQGFNASFYLRPEKFNDSSFFLVFMHELRHVYDFHSLWINKNKMTEAELEKRGFRLMSKLYQEMPHKNHFFRFPTFWDNDWKNLSANEIERKREEKIDKWMKNNDFYKELIKNPENFTIDFAAQNRIQFAGFNPIEEDEESKGEKLPSKMILRQSGNEVHQNVKELSFQPEKAKNSKNSEELLRAALANEKNLFQKMDNFVYDQNLQLQCWKNQKVEESFEITRLIARTNSGETLFNGQNNPKTNVLPKCVLNIDSIKTDATETFWAAPYLDQMPIKFEHFTELEGIKVARYTVFQPSTEKFNEISKQYSHIKPFKVFVGTIFVSVEDAQIIKFWGTSFPEATNANNSKSKIYSSYCATAIREKLSSGIWVTTVLNTVAVTNDNNKMKPFSYLVKYQNYRQGETDVKMLDDETAVN